MFQAQGISDSNFLYVYVQLYIYDVCFAALTGFVVQSLELKCFLNHDTINAYSERHRREMKIVHCTYNCLFSMELRALVAVAEVADNANSTSGGSGSSSRSTSENKIK